MPNTAASNATRPLATRCVDDDDGFEEVAEAAGLVETGTGVFGA